MKPAKKKPDPKNIQKQANEISSTSKIKTYFKPAPKLIDVEKSNEKHSEGPKQFYIQALKEKIEAIGNSENINEMDGACAVAEAIVVNVKKIGGSLSRDCSVCKQVQKECNEWRGKYKDMKKMFVELTVSYAELDLKYKHLSKSACGKNGALSEASTANENVESADIFTPAELKFLEYMPLDKTADSTFVLQCLKYLYKDDPKSLAEKTLFGTKDSIKFTNDGAEVHHPGKQAVTPTKARRIKALFVERVLKCGMNSAEFKERIHEPYVHKLIASGIKNMSK